ncbi:hypothetical protein BVC93_27270 [Mycobacterium sp. MS1601]|uniref:hypothetical protein n=1 Tax=Mycobacterium sp. MS1601 TaxID=1936029 RepID=UPI0009792322|nr:hypothetical protein [Mycobacterium sp. MS1601]AQA05463.1 hypothetical protein BVC93_27270 [Mycobacterium sp. MS1601]
MSATFRRGGWRPEALESIKTLGLQDFSGTSVETSFKAHTPDDQAFAGYREKMEILDDVEPAAPDLF